MKKKVLVAMSGGVDSSVAAYLLRQTTEAAGVTFQLFAAEDNEKKSRKDYCSPSDIEDARKVAERLEMPHYVFNLTESFYDQVILRFAQAYQRGITPNPCVDCNRYIKFNGLWQCAQQIGFDYLATGHYARVEFDDESGRYLLKRSLDEFKDQSYMLYTMTQKILSKTLFPLGNLRKNQVREIADQQGFINAYKPDSQDICFVKDGDYSGYLENVLGIESSAGDFIDQSGQVLGRHKGLFHYTVGQRKGLNLSFGEPKYVIALNQEDNTVTLGSKNELLRSSLVADDVNLIAIEKLVEPLTVTVKTRYRQTDIPAIIKPLDKGQILVEFAEPQQAVSPGQAVVFYRGETVVGGGTIL
ncbi:MAG: tRNA 2-thiouridine(34) synthase MnmA [Bacillota bacterium]|jgi:tRNA-specific 2-thiouridylase